VHQSESTARIVQFIFVGSLVPALLGSLMLALLWPDYLPLLFSLIGFAFLGHYLAGRNKNNNWLLSIALLNTLILTPEVVLRLSQFHYESGIQFAFPRSFQKFVEDEDLFWVLPAGQPGVNSLGFPGDEIETPKPADRCRILFLGDSVPMQGYPEVVEALLNQQQLAVPVESISLAMSGYSSYQGRVLIDKYGAMVDPDLVVVSYGWNDHWLAYGMIDSQKEIDLTERSQLDQSFIIVYNNFRLLQWLRYIFIPLLGGEVPLVEVRVPLNEYVANLTYIGNFFAVDNIPVLFIIPPTTHPVFGVPDYLFEDGFAADKESVIRLHRAYNETLREVVVANQWLVLDMATEFEDRPDLSEIFIFDGIHLTDLGVNMFGERIADTLVGHGCLLPQP
jgi:lysophospholipase L1-like esterase